MQYIINRSKAFEVFRQANRSLLRTKRAAPFINAMQDYRRMSTQSLPQVAQAAVYTECGDPSEVVRVVERKLFSSDEHAGLKPDTILIKMLAAPVNPSDINQIEGTYPVKGRFASFKTTDGTVLESAAVGGNEGVGEVIATGSGTSLQVGDWVVPQRAGEFGTWSTHAVVDTNSVALIPKDWHQGVDPLLVGSLKVNPSTAYRMLKDFGDIAPGQYVIQNGANSGVGRAVIQLAKSWGIRTINVIRDRENYEQLKADLESLGADIVIKDKDLVNSETKRMLKNLDAPVRLGFNCVGGKPTLAMTRFISQGGTLVTYGGMSRQPVTMHTSLLLFKDIRACGFWMNRWYEANSKDTAGERGKMWSEILYLARKGQFKAQPMECIQWAGNALPSANEAKVRKGVSWSSSKYAFVF